MPSRRGRVRAEGFRAGGFQSAAGGVAAGRRAAAVAERLHVRPRGFLTEADLAKTWQPRQLAGIAFRLGPPVHGWLYSDTSHILPGMIIQKVTGQSPVTGISRRILAPPGLHGTSFPLASKQIPALYAHGYYGPADLTNAVNPSIAWTAGAMISTVDDIARLYRALLHGRLLPPARQRQLLAAIPVHDTGGLFAEHCGLGIYQNPGRDQG